MAVSVLDAALTFVADTTQTDAAFNQLPTKAEASFGEASLFAQQFNAVMDATAENISLAGANLPTLGKAFATLRITGPDHLRQGVENATLAFTALQEAGVTASGTLLQAQIKVVEKQLAYAKAVGDSTVALDAELVSLQREYSLLGGSTAAKEAAAAASKALAEADKAAALAAQQAATEQARIATATQQISASTRAAAAEITPAWLAATQAELAYAAAQKEVQAASLLVEASAGADAEAVNLLAAAQQNAARASVELAEAQKAVAASSTEEAAAIDLVGGALGTLTSLLGISLGVGFFVHFLDETAKAVDEVDDLSAATGLAIPQIVGLKKAMEEAGDDSSRLGAQLSKVASGLTQAASGAAEKRDVFRALGVQFNEATGAAPPLLDALLQISDHLHETQASGDTLGLAFKALGKNSIELISFLGQGSSAIREQIGSYKDLGDEIQNTVDAGAEFQKLESQLGADIKSFTLPGFRLLVDIIRFTAAGLISAKGELENFGREALLQGQVLFDLARGLDNFNKAAIRVDFSGMEQAFKGTITRIKDDIALAEADMAETTKRTAESAAKFLTDLSDKPNKINLSTQIVPEGNENQIAEEAKRQLDAQLARIEAFKSGVHLAFAQGQVDAAEWAAAQVRAADAADIAQERYLQKLIVGFRQSGDVQKEQAAIQELATLKVKDAAKETDSLAAAIQKHNEFALGMVKSWADLQSQNVAKTWQEATKAAQELVQAENRLHEAQQALNSAQLDARFGEQIRQIEELAAVGIVSEEQKAARLRQIYEEEEKAQLDSLTKLSNQQIDAINIAQERVEQARENPFFTDAQLDNLEKNLDKALTDYAKTQAQIVEAQQQADSRVQSIDQQILRRATASWDGYFATIIAGSLRSGLAVKTLGTLVAQGIGASVAAAVSGTQGFAQAMAQMLKSALAALAGESIVRALKEIAEAFSALANPFTAHLAPGHFLAAAKWGAVGAAAALTGAAIPSGNNSSSQNTGPGNAPSQTQSPATTAEQNPVRVTNIQRFAAGGLISRQTLAILGDSPSGGNAREGVLPLEDRATMDELGATIAAHIGVGGGDVHYHIKGDVIDYNQLMRKQSRATKRGQGKLTSSDTLRVTRR